MQLFTGNGDDSIVLYKEKKCHKSSPGHERYRGVLRVVCDIRMRYIRAGRLTIPNNKDNAYISLIWDTTIDREGLQKFTPCWARAANTQGGVLS